MAKTATDIITRALTLIDERITDIEDAASTEMSLTDMAKEILPEVARNLIKELPFELKKYLVKTASLSLDTLSTGESQSAYTKQKVVFISPDDFWELVSLQLTVWAIPVTSYILIDSPEYSTQNNPFTRGGKQNPVVAVSDISTGANRTFRIECFSVSPTDAKTVSKFEYVSFNNYPNDSGNSWPDELFEKITRALASELNVIKGRLQEGEIQGQEALKSIEQHE
ncbi:MAG: hypothetical protein LLF95_11195 [Bacteroidales bacterium]|nr:hypothetical protein [Bacteroidales bacterium]